jgi:hypothetical protein
VIALTSFVEEELVQQASLETIPAPPGHDHLSDSRIRQILGYCLHSVPSRQLLRLALARSFSGESRPFEQIAPFYTAFGWSGISLKLDDLHGTYILGDAELLQPHLSPEQPDAEPDRPAQPGRWRWLKRVWPSKSATEVESRESPDAPEKMVEESKPIPVNQAKSDSGPMVTAK